MKRPVVLVLTLTFAALVVASLWVPVESYTWVGAGPPAAEWRWIGGVVLAETESGYIGGPEGLEPQYLLRLDLLLFEYLLILAAGGLSAVALHVRGRRRISRVP